MKSISVIKDHLLSGADQVEEVANVLNNLVDNDLPNAVGEVIVALDEVDDFLDKIRPVVRRLASLPLVRSIPYVALIVEGLDRVEQVLDGIPGLAD